MKIENQIKGFIRLEDNLFVSFDDCVLKNVKSANGKIAESYIFNNEIITKYKWRYIIECSECDKEVRMRKDHYNEYRKKDKICLCMSCQQKGERNRFWSSDNPINWTAREEYEDKKIEANKKQSETKKNFSQKKWDSISNKRLTPEYRKNLSNGLKNYLNNLKNNDFEKYSAWMKRLNNRNVIKSKAHKKVENQLKSLGFDFVSEYRIKGKKLYRYDIYIPSENLLIEVNGDKVHANPKKYKAEDIIKDQWRTTTAKDRWDYDNEKRIYAEDRNYNTLTIWSSDIFKKSFSIEKLI
jgi:hypothetical protein